MPIKTLKNILTTVGIFLFLFKGLTVAEEVNTSLPPNVPPHTSRIMPEIVVVNFHNLKGDTHIKFLPLFCIDILH